MRYQIFLGAQREAVVGTHAEVMTVIDRYSLFSMWYRLYRCTSVDFTPPRSAIKLGDER